MRRPRKALHALGMLAALFAAPAAHGEGPFERAVELASEKRYSEARDVLAPLLEREPGHPRARLLDGILHARAGRLDAAAEVFEALRRDHPDMSEPYNNLAVIHALQGRLDDARTSLLALLQRRPDAVAYANLGDVYTALARHAYQSARELEPDGGIGPEPAMDTAFALPETPAASPGMERGERSPNREQDPDDGRTPVSGAASTPASFCAHAGGFDDRRSVADAALWLQSHGAEVVEVRHEERQVVGRYRVFLPPAASREAAVEKLREIRRRGIRDVAVIDDGALANGISFGVFRSADNMHRRVAALDRDGYPVRSVPEEVKIVEDYVIRVRAGGAPATLYAAWEARFPGRSIRAADCG